MTASTAAALAILVLDVNLKRRSNAGFRDDMSNAIEAIRATQQRFYRSADEDLRLLNALFEAQREARQSGDRTPYLKALEAAAREPLAIARDCVELLTIIHGQVARASRFTVSDFGAAVTLADGALRAALIMTEVNVSLLADESSADRSTVAAIADEVKVILQNGDELTHSIEARTRSAMRGENGDRKR